MIGIGKQVLWKWKQRFFCGRRFELEILRKLISDMIGWRCTYLLSLIQVRISLRNGVGLIVGGLALTVTLRLTFGWAVLMSVFVVFGLGQVIRHLRWGN